MKSPDELTCRESFQRWKKLAQEHMDDNFSARKRSEPPASKLSPSEEVRRKMYVEQHARRSGEDKKAFDESQWIEHKGEPYYCGNNTSRGNCNFVSQPNMKCACQKLYTDRKHLESSCDPSGWFLLGGLTEQRCRDNGLLEDDFPKLASRMQVTYDGINSTAATVVPPPAVAPSNNQRMVSFPSHSCPVCEKEFDALQQEWNANGEFSWDNLRKLNDCIDNNYSSNYSLTPGWEHRPGAGPIHKTETQRIVSKPEEENEEECSCTGASTSHRPCTEKKNPLSQQRIKSSSSSSPSSSSGPSTPSLSSTGSSRSSSPSGSSSDSSSTHQKKNSKSHTYSDTYTNAKVVVKEKESVQGKPWGGSSCSQGQALGQFNNNPLFNDEVFVARVSQIFQDKVAGLRLPTEEKVKEEKPILPAASHTKPTSPYVAQDIPPDIYSHLMQGGTNTEQGQQALGPSYVNPFPGTPGGSTGPASGVGVGAAGAAGASETTTSSSKNVSPLTYVLIIGGCLLFLGAIIMGIYLWNGEFPWGEKKQHSHPSQIATFVNTAGTAHPSAANILQLPAHTTRPNGFGPTKEELEQHSGSTSPLSNTPILTSTPIPVPTPVPTPSSTPTME